MLHPNLDLDEETITCMMSNAVDHPISDAYYDDKIEEYYTISGVSLHHILIATQTCCVICGSLSKTDASKLKTVIVYSCLSQEPRSGTIMPTRCTKRTCRHRGNYGWDIVPATLSNGRMFKPLNDRHTLPYWVSSARTAFKRV